MPKNIALLIARDATDMCTVAYSDKPDLIASWIETDSTDLTEDILAHVLQMQIYCEHPMTEAELRYEFEAPYGNEWGGAANPYTSKALRLAFFLPRLLGNCGDGVIVVAVYEGNVDYT